MRSQHVQFQDGCLQYVYTSTDMRVAATSPPQAVAQHSLVLRCCIFIAIDYVDFVYDYVSVHLACTVFIRLFGFFAVFFELRRYIIRIIRPCARSSGFISSLHPGSSLRFVQHHLVASVAILFYRFVGNRGLHRHLLLAILRL
jgi:hypothetical protein